MQGIRRFKRGLGVLQKEAKGDIKIQHMFILIELALSSPDPMTYAEIQKRCKMTKASVSRNMKLLGELQVKGKSGQWENQGLNLVTVRMNPYNTRELIAELSLKGVAVMVKVNDTIDS